MFGHATDSPAVRGLESRGAGAPEADVEVQRMIEAGLDALMSRYQDLVWPELDAYPVIVCVSGHGGSSRLIWR